MISIAICDDKEQEVELMYNIVSNRLTKLHLPFNIIRCFSGEDLLYEVKRIGDFDLIFLDIVLGSDNGIDIAAKIRESNSFCYIVFVSGFEQYYKAAFNVQPYQFLDKPINKAEVEHVVDSVSKQIMNNNQIFSFESKRKQYRIRLNDILYFISDYRVVKVYITDGSVYEFYGRMDEVEAQINQMTTIFIRVHKSYLLNMNHIKVFQCENIIMQDEKSFAISVRKRKNVIEQYMSFVSI